MEQKSLFYNTVEAAFEEYEEDGVFSSTIEVELTKEHVEHTRTVAQKIFGINIPDEYIVRMLSCNSRLAKEAFNMTMTDTDARGALMGYLAYNLLNLSWPMGATPKEERNNFFKLWREKIVSLKWGRPRL